MKTFWKNFFKILIVIALIISAFAVGVKYSDSVLHWEDKSFVSKDSKIVGEWKITSLELIKGNESFKLSAEDFEDFYLNYDGSTASELEKRMYDMADELYAQKFEFKKDNTLEIYKINSDGEREINDIMTWTFEKGIVSLENEETSLTCHYDKNGTFADTEFSGGVIMRQTMVRK